MGKWWRFRWSRFGGGAPGSRQLRDLEPEFFVYQDTPEKIARYSTPEGRAELEEIGRRAKKESLVLAIERAMSARSPGKSTKPAAGFAVKGIDRAALQGVYDVLVKGEEPTDLFRAGNDVSVVFLPPQSSQEWDSIGSSWSMAK